MEICRSQLGAFKNEKPARARIAKKQSTRVSDRMVICVTKGKRRSLKKDLKERGDIEK